MGLVENKRTARDAAEAFYVDNGIDEPVIPFTVEWKEDPSNDGEYLDGEIFLYPTIGEDDPGFPGLTTPHWQGKLVHEHAHERYQAVVDQPDLSDLPDDADVRITNEELMARVPVEGDLDSMWVEIWFGDREYTDIETVAETLAELQYERAAELYGEEGAERVIQNNGLNGIDETQARIMENLFLDKEVTGNASLYDPNQLLYYQGRGRDVAHVDVERLAREIEEMGYDRVLAMAEDEQLDRYHDY